MTGFGMAAGAADGVEYAVEIRSVNNRYLKFTLRLPDGLQPLEADIEKILRRRLARGTVTLVVRMKVLDEQAACRVNTSVLTGYLEQLKLLEVEANPTLRLDLGSLLQLPGVCEPPPLAELAEKTRDGFLALVEEAARQLVRMRETEGRTIADDLDAHGRVIRENLDAVAARTGDVVKLYHERLRSRVAELTAEAKVRLDEETLAREVAIFADRSDIAEEVSRLGAHLEQFAQACRAEQPAGRKLDFIAQEMLREANTIGSKASDARIAQAVVEMKTAIDRIKEQAANVE